MIDTSSDLTGSITGERLVGTYTGESERPSADAVAQLAYRFYLMRGQQDGRDTEDWLIAEGELTQHYRWLKTLVSHSGPWLGHIDTGATVLNRQHTERDIHHETRNRRRHWPRRIKARHQTP